MRKAAPVRRGEILDEAIRQIGRLGFRGFTIRELSSACDMSNAGMLHYFASKDELLMAVIDRLEQRQTSALQKHIEDCDAALRAGQPMLGKVRALLAAMMRQVMDDRELARLVVTVQVEAIEPSHPAHESFRRREAAALAFLERFLAPMLAAPADVARGLHAAMVGFAQQWLREDGGFDLLHAWDIVALRLLSSGAASSRV